MTGGFQLTHPRSPTSSEPGTAGDFVLTLWTDDAALARRADLAGVQRIGLDLETRGKLARQRGLGTWISPHTVERLPDIRAALHRAKLFARVNPLYDGSHGEVELLLERGVQVLMLPMFRSATEIERFASIVAGRATIVPLLETREAVERISQIVAVEGLEEIHIGLNDLAISLGTRNRFEVLTSRLAERLSATVQDAGLRFGIGAIGRLNGPRLPIDADLIYARYAQLGSRAALIARAYAVGTGDDGDLCDAVRRSRERLGWWQRASGAQHRHAFAQLRSAVSRCPTW